MCWANEPIINVRTKETFSPQITLMTQLSPIRFNDSLIREKFLSYLQKNIFTKKIIKGLTSF